MVVKMVVEMGSWWRKERNMVVLLLFVVVRMEKEMEGRMVEELVAEMVEIEGGRPKEGAKAVMGLLFRLL